MIVHPFFYIVVINHPSIDDHNKNIYYLGIIFEIQTFPGSAFSMMFCIQ